MSSSGAAAGFGLLSATSWGGSDFVGGLGARRAPALLVVVSGHTFTLIVLLAVCLSAPVLPILSALQPEAHHAAGHALHCCVELAESVAPTLVTNGKRSSFGPMERCHLQYAIHRTVKQWLTGAATDEA